MRKRNKLVCGVGKNDADYVVTKYESRQEGGKQKIKCVWRCPFYRKWNTMLVRCYSPTSQKQKPSYVGCSVCDDWLTFSNFKAWMETQDWEGKEIDKDILVKGNKIYSPDTCVFITARVNKFFGDHKEGTGNYLPGVSWHKRYGKFRARCTIDGEVFRETKSDFNTELEAHQAWLKCKQEMALKLAAEQTDPRVAKALIERYANYVVE